jgi:GDP-L-fucose synthase
MLDIQSRAYNDQYKTGFKTAIPNNIYGKNDLYSGGCHVIPSLMKKFHVAKIFKNPFVEVWGDGSCLREFTYAPDMAKCLFYVYNYYKGSEPVNIGNSVETSIKQLAELIKEIVEYPGEIKWNDKMPSGQLRKPSSTQKFNDMLDINKLDIKFTPLKEGLIETYKWFERLYPNIRV